MDTSLHNMTGLFDQLGLPSTPQAITDFINAHRAQMGDGPLEQAPFWNQNQADFIRQSITDDSDWAPVVDELNALLRG